MRCVGVDRIFGFGRHNHSVVCRSLKEVGRLSWRPLSLKTRKRHRLNHHLEALAQDALRDDAKGAGRCRLSGNYNQGN